ncbi:type III-A CRISPR-associated RAMP protein Csm5 [Nostoc sp. TCL26-01]|uniref:type III-A CRISPR-associated RAMP protein Csm5 n=1 Tax=Nostoc sp. TCL26-01 TaxID=2576904 RepID=UPI0015B9E1DF|nr:type III-A CRISPR-associated RAMP protein Csm5 [Nostoc sp. TCL26-01]QLE58529.1 type III-A CRISPR-associated RAMP protein Csm5 [Nostoc sp. TCL26-01]
MVSSPNTIQNQLNAYKECNYQSQRIQLTSPLIHIGSAESTLTPFDYIQRDIHSREKAINRLIYFPNQDALIAVLSQRGELHNYIKLTKEYINERYRLIQKRENVLNLLEKILGSNWWTACSSDNTLIFPTASISYNKTDQEIKKLRPLIRNGLGELYIPGTSIKGAIRTAIAYYLLKHQVHTTILSDIEQKLIQLNFGSIKRKKAYLDDEKLIRLANNLEISLNSYLFSNFRLMHEYCIVEEINTPNTDLMRAIKVTDSSSLHKSDGVNLSIVSEVISSSFYVNGSERFAKESATNFVEMVWNAQTEFTLTIDTEMLSQFQHEQGMQLPRKLWTIEGILEICQEFAQAQWEHEKKYWNSITDNPSDEKLNFSRIRKFYNNNCSYNLRVGWGSGMIGTTIGLHFNEETREHIRNACGTSTNSSETPKSRRTAIIPTQTKTTKRALGWVQLTPAEAVC